MQTNSFRGTRSAQKAHHAGTNTGHQLELQSFSTLDLKEPEDPHPGDHAPDFGLKDTAEKEWQLHELKGKPVVPIIGSCPSVRLGALAACRFCVART
jgi:hypothetical protein